MIPQPRFHIWDSTAKIAQPRIYNHDATVKIPQKGLHMQNSKAGIPQTGCHNQYSTAMIPRRRFRNQDYSANAVWVLALGSCVSKSKYKSQVKLTSGFPGSPAVIDLAAMVDKKVA